MAYCHFVLGSEQLDVISVNDEELRMMGGSSQIRACAWEDRSL